MWGERTQDCLGRPPRDKMEATLQGAKPGIRSEDVEYPLSLGHGEFKPSTTGCGGKCVCFGERAEASWNASSSSWRTHASLMVSEL